MLGRRAFLVGMAAAGLACKSERASGGGPPGPSGPPPVPSSPNVRLLEWDLGTQAWGPARAVVVVPTWGGDAARYPVLIALHGRGEALKPPAEGAMGWPRDYAMVHVIDRLRAPPLTATDHEGFVTPAHLAEENAWLASHPFGGLVVACPYLPDIRPATSGDLSDYGRFLVDVLLPRLHAETPAIARPEATGIDGVSLGGVTALRIGLSRPDVFGAVGGIQPAVQRGQDAEWTALAQAARARRPDLKLRLLTSHDDYFREPVIGISHAWSQAGVDHDFAEVPGPHDYVFNRGPGSIELLLWHDRVLAHA